VRAADISKRSTLPRRTHHGCAKINDRDLGLVGTGTTVKK
jgi:hypothetical protein